MTESQTDVPDPNHMVLSRVFIEVVATTSWPIEVAASRSAGLDALVVFAACEIARPSHIVQFGAADDVPALAALVAARHIGLTLTCFVAEAGVSSERSEDRSLAFERLGSSFDTIELARFGTTSASADIGVVCVDVDDDDAVAALTPQHDVDALADSASLVTVHGDRARVDDLIGRTRLTVLLDASEGDHAAVVAVLGKGVGRTAEFIEDLSRHVSLRPLVERQIEARARGATAEAQIAAAIDSLGGDFGAIAYRSALAEADRMRRFGSWDARAAPAPTEAPIVATDPLLRFLLRLKWKIGRSRIGNALRPLYESVVGRGG